MESSSSSFQYFIELLKKGISPDINSTKIGLLKERTFQRKDLVILQREKYFLISLDIGRVTKVYPGRDGGTRITKLRTPTNEIVRLANKIYLMEGSNN